MCDAQPNYSQWHRFLGVFIILILCTSVCVCLSFSFLGGGGGGDAFSGISFCKIYVAIHVDHR